MSSELTYASAYQKEELIEQSMYSTLFVGKKGDARQAVLVRHWPTAHAVTPEEQTRIQTEVAALRAVRHPHLLPVLEVSATSQGIFLLSVQTPGGVLSTHLARHFARPLPQAEALLLISQVGQALAALHQQGIIHSNLSPHAIFFDTPEHAYLGECRLAGILACIPDYQPALDEGTPRCWYMAPEEFSGVSDASTDQYALGCLAYQLFTGRVPFAGSARATLRQKHLQDQPRPLSDLNPALPAPLADAVLKALAKQPAERYATVQAFLDVLGQPRREALAKQQTGKQPVPGVTWTGSLSAVAPGEQRAQDAAATTRVGRRTVLVPLPHRPSPGGQPSTPLLPRRRRRWVLLCAALLVMLLIVLTSRWLFFPGSHTRTRTGLATTTASLLTAGLTPSTGQTPTAQEQSPTSVAASTPSPTATPLPAARAVVPVLDCVTPMGSSLVAEFGYQNPNAFAVTIAPGARNALTPASANGLQPTVFAPGSHQHMFQVSFFKRGSVTWVLDGMTVVARSNSPQC